MIYYYSAVAYSNNAITDILYCIEIWLLLCVYLVWLVAHREHLIKMKHWDLNKHQIQSYFLTILWNVATQLFCKIVMQINRLILQV